MLVIEANFDVGGHAAISGGNLPLGGGTSAQKRAGIVDSPDLLFADLTDWSVVQSNGAPDYRYNDREIIRAFADWSAPTYEWLLEQGCVFIDSPIDNRGAQGTGNSAPREAHFAAMDWVQYQTGKAQPPERGPLTSSGIGLVRPLEAKAREMGARIVLNTKMTSLIREPGPDGRVIGVVCERRRRHAQSPRAAGRHPGHRRLHQQRQLPPHLRPEADGGVLRRRRRAVLGAGRQR